MYSCERRINNRAHRRKIGIGLPRSVIKEPLRTGGGSQRADGQARKGGEPRCGVRSRTPMAAQWIARASEIRMPVHIPAPQSDSYACTAPTNPQTRQRLCNGNNSTSAMGSQPNAPLQTQLSQSFVERYARTMLLFLLALI